MTTEQDMQRSEPKGSTQTVLSRVPYRAIIGSVINAAVDRSGLAMLVRQLTAWGYEVVSAQDGQEAWDKFQADSFSLVISDWLMPKMNGLDLLRNVRASQQAHYVYCILLTSKSQLEDLIQGMDAGADDFLTKPFDISELRVRLNAGRRIVDLERNLSNANRRMQQELRTAASIQRSLLPVRLPDSFNDSFAWSYEPCDELGGDILNVLPLGAGQVALYLLDVSGHGVSAALLSVALSRLLTTATNTSSIIREKAEIGSEYRIVPPHEVLARLNQRFYLDLAGERFFSMMYGVLDLRSNRLCYASGGHNPALVLRHGGDVKKLASTGPLVGILEDATFEEDVIQLEPHDRLLIYSDGITEAVGPSGEQFGLERLITLVQAAQRDSLQDALNQLMQSVQDWASPGGLQDDASCLIAQAATTGELEHE